MEAKKTSVTDFLGWLVLHGLLAIVTLGLWLVILNLWIVYKLDRAS